MYHKQSIWISKSIEKVDRNNVLLNIMCNMEWYLIYILFFSVNLASYYCKHLHEYLQKHHVITNNQYYGFRKKT